jgi:hypothetical protein
LIEEAGMFDKIRFVFLVLPIIAVVAIAAACNSDDDLEPRVARSEEQSQALEDQLSRIEEQNEELRTILDKTQVLSAINSIRGVPLHDMDVALQTASEIPSNVSASQVRRARQAVQSVTWPHALEEDAADLLKTLKEFEDALGRSDLAAAKKAATEAHDTWHDFEGPATAFLTGEQAAGH